ncbi:MAG TPA: acyl-CoA dehydrogenase family protein [Hyphomicrobiaceae bacterium]|jgi:pimeloyl-CoA dehydrogenase large subunit|nr:acyl-CoA dehydrogenase family protein [Hyphomicrobiaceae bacterium]
MDLRFSPEENAFRQELRSFFRSAVPESIRNKVSEHRHISKEEWVTAHKALHAKGLAVPHWPKEWGGADWTPVQHYIYTEELQFNGVPQPLPFNVAMCGPVVIAFGSDAQKQRFLPRLASLDDWWCQGFSEPGAGSDLAGLKTAAVRKSSPEGDHYVVNGQKTWTTMAQHANWIFCLVRTDPAAKKQLGISFLLIDMMTPGITVRPIQTIDGGREVNEVFFDDVKVPVENLVGQENRGWDCAKFLLGNERTGIARVGYSKQRVERIKELAGRVMAGDRPLIEDWRFREKLAAVEVELKALEMTQMRILSDDRHRKDNTPNPMSSILKIKGSEIQQATTALALEIAGPLALPYQPEHEEPELGHNEPPMDLEWAAPAAPAYFNYRKVSIYGGSNEIQRNILAKAVLGF